jgi:predicted GIY-YIG superfamily endonuclease
VAQPRSRRRSVPGKARRATTGLVHTLKIQIAPAARLRVAQPLLLCNPKRLTPHSHTTEDARHVVRLHPPQHEFSGSEYTGATADLKQRLADHNASKSAHTSKFTPWQLAWYRAFPDKLQALSFETYLKSHSGRAFAKKRLLKPAE